MTSTSPVLTETDIAQRTFRYVRIAVVGAVLMLLASIALEASTVDWQWRSSVSSYYWTPVGPVFIASLVTSGICLIAIQGSTATEDVLLNVAGALAPIVAFVPIPDPGERSSLTASLQATSEQVVARSEQVTDLNVANNIWAYVIAGLIVSVAVWIILRRSGSGLTRGQWLGFGVLVLVLGVGGWLFVFQRGWFREWAHTGSAVTLFLVLLVVMVANARGFGRTHANAGVRGRRWANRYALVAVATGAGVLAFGAARLVGGWQGAVFWLELVVIIGFAVFWVIQTVELWDAPAGVRDDPEGVMPPTPEG